MHAECAYTVHGSVRSAKLTPDHPAAPGDNRSSLAIPMMDGDADASALRQDCHENL